MSEELCILNGGIQTIAPQLVYLDFDGAVTSYVNADLGVAIGSVTVEDSGFDDAEITVIVNALNCMFDDVSFTSALPADDEFSTIYVGVTSAFDEYGSFLGLAETIDSGNIIRDDNAFVLLDSSATAELVVSVIAHETEHIVHGMDHGGVGLGRFAQDYIVSSGKVSSGVRINVGDEMTISDGGTATSTAMWGGVMHVNSAKATNTTMDGGFMFVYSGGKAISTTMIRYCEMRVFSGGTASSTTLNGGSMKISSGGTATNTTVSGGSMNVYNNGSAISTTMYGGEVGDIVSGGSVTITNVSGGRMNVGSGGKASRTTVSGGVLTVSSGGKASSTTVSGGIMRVFAEGTVTSTTLSGGVLWVVENGSATSTTVSGGIMDVNNSGAATSTTVNGGKMNVFSGGTANITTVMQGCKMNVFSGGTATITTVMAGGSMYVYTDGSVTSTTVSGGKMDVYDNGTATSTTVNGGSMYVYNNGTATSTTVADGEMAVYSGGTATRTKVMAGGEMDVYSGGAATSTSVLGGGMNVYKSGNATSTTVTIGSMAVYSGGTATSTTIANGGNMSVFSGGTANITSVNGNMSVFSGGTANDTTVAKGTLGGNLFVLDGGTANDTVVSAFFGTIVGRMTISSGGEANRTTLSGGVMDVFNGGVANSTTVDIGGNMNSVNGSLTVHDGGMAKNTTVKSGGQMFISEGGMALNTTVNDGGRLFIYEGGMYGGALQIAEGGIVSAYTGATIDFTVAGQVERGTVLINRYDLISGAPTFTITVSGDEENGAYALAGYASFFNSTVTVKTTSGDELGSLTVGESILSDKTIYSLTVETGILFLNIFTDNTPPTVSVTVGKPDKDGTALVSVVPSEELSEGLYSWNGGELTELPEDNTLKVSENGVISFQLTDMVGNVATEEYKINAFDVLLKDVKCETDGNNAVVDWSGDETREWSRSYDARVSNGDGTVVVDGLAASGLELLNLPAGAMSVAVKPAQSDIWTELDALEIPEVSDDRSVAIVGVENGMTEVMFARGGSVWSGGYRAWHAGVGDWGGTGQSVVLEGRNLLDDIFLGSDDASLLLLTDDTNGDALFVDDIYSAFPYGIDVQARVAKIDEIRAGTGDDIVDFTSPRYKYVGVGLTIRGGDGNDVIWANSGDNKLFGDAGDDSIVGSDGNDVIVGGAGDDVMHGGGGDDIFCFCGGWGNDSVEQLASGTVTLWFADGDESKWDAEKLTYTDGENSVTVTGVADVTLLFGNADERYGGLLAAGAFDAFSSERIFEGRDAGILIVA